MILVIPIEPKPQSRPGFTKRGKFVTAYEKKDMKIWRKSCTYLVKSLWKAEKIEGAIEVDVTFYMKAPQSISKKPTPRARPETWAKWKKFENEEMPHTKKLDLDNLIKSLFDSVTDSGLVWNDDGQVCRINAKKIYSPNPRIEVDIKNYDNIHS